jgi:methyltransferase (TIGR00027 family)
VPKEASPAADLGTTAFWTAAVRAREQAREDRLFDDPWAAELAGEVGRRWIDQRSPDSVVAIALRTRYFDDYLQRVASDGVRQFVLMAAGLDTRAFRLSWPRGLRWFELDQAPVLAHKQRILGSESAKTNCDRRAVAADLTSAWEPALVEAGFDPRRPSCWLLEGFLFYLPSQTVTELLERALGLAAPGSRIGLDIINGLTLTSPITRSWVDMQAAAGAPWIGSMDDPAGFLAAHDWQAVLTSPGESEADHGRWSLPVVPTTMPGIPHLWFVTGWKRGAS